ncbi:uncharacterized protein ACBT44_010002 isoform 1-T1 [Syngnathus typhle]
MEMKHYAREDDKESQNISIHVCRELAKDLSQNKTRRGSSCRQFLEKLQDLKTWTPTNRCKTFSACRWMEVFSFVLSRTQFCKMERLRLQNPENICSPPVPNANYDLKPKLLGSMDRSERHQIQAPPSLQRYLVRVRSAPSGLKGARMTDVDKNQTTCDLGQRGAADTVVPAGAP